MRTLSIVIIILAVSLPPGSLLRADSQGKNGAVLNLLVGSVTMKRGDREMKPSVGSGLEENDIFRLGANSMVEIVLPGTDHSIRLTGPVVYRLRLEKISKNTDSGDMFSRLQKMLAKNSEPYAPRTIVSAVRGEEDQSEKLNAGARELLQKGIENYREGRYDVALEKLSGLEKTEGLNRTARSFIDFYRAHVHFERMEYRKALELYSGISRQRFSRFEKKEESLSRAVLCAHLLGDDQAKEDLIAKYRDAYGESGQYWKMIISMN